MNGTRLSAVLGEQAGRLHRGGDLRGRRAAPPARQVGRHRQPARHRRLPAARGGHLAARAGGHVGCAWPRSPACWITPRWSPDPAGPDSTAYRAFLAASGFTELTRTERH